MGLTQCISPLLMVGVTGPAVGSLSASRGALQSNLRHIVPTSLDQHNMCHVVSGAASHTMPGAGEYVRNTPLFDQIVTD
jgi:hypothetical protein